MLRLIRTRISHSRYFTRKDARKCETKLFGNQNPKKRLFGFVPVSAVVHRTLLCNQSNFKDSVIICYLKQKTSHSLVM